MYLVLSIISGDQRGASHVFGREGGIIGRSGACDWTLRDPTNTISGRHAAVSFADNRFFVTDTSTNGTFLNGSPTAIGKGRAAPLHPGDRLVIGDFTLAAEISDQPSGAAPMAGAADGRARVPAGGDPLAGLAGLGAQTGGQTGDVLAALGPQAGPQAPPRRQGGAGRLDDLVGGGTDHGGFVPTAPPPPPPASHASPMAPGPAVNSAPPSSATAADTHSAAASAIPDYLSVEYLLSGQKPAQAVPSPEPAPQPVASPPPTQPMPAAPPPPPQAPVMPQPEELSSALRASYVALGDGAASANGDARPAAIDPVSVLRQRSEGRERARAAPVPSPHPIPEPAPMPQPAPPHPVTEPAPETDLTSAPRPAGGMALPEAPSANGDPGESEAFWTGLGVEAGNVPEERRPELLAEVGRALREIGQGFVEVLAARRSVKEEFRIEQTQLQAAENNPFKFFTSGEKALARIIVGDDGYMPLDEAVRESLIDIKAHEVASMAALQAAVTHVLSRLDPQQIGQSVNARGVFGRGQDKKALWDRFAELHAELSGDVDGAARQIVSEAFMEAYERQLRQMRGEGQ